MLPNSALDSTAPVARSLASCTSSVSIRFRDAFARLRSRAFSLDNDLIVAFWRRDLRNALRNSASAPRKDFDKDFPVARSLASWASDASRRVLDPFTALRSRAFSLLSTLIVVFWRRDLLRATRKWAASSDGSFDSVAPTARSLTSRAFKASLPALAPSRAMRSQKTSSVSDRTLSD